MEKFLEETQYCDISHPTIKKHVKSIIDPSRSDKENAVEIFNFVRDNVAYALDFYNKKASDTLKSLSGMCTNKSNLLIAMLRTAGIPAGYGILKVNAKEYFGPIMLPIFKKLVSSESSHVYTVAFISNKWIKCDPSTDIELSRKTSKITYTTELVVWDGEKDAMDRIDPRHILIDTFPLSNIDEKLSKKPKNLNKNLIKLGNKYLFYLRNHLKQTRDLMKIERDFSTWLRDSNKNVYEANKDIMSAQ